MPVVANAQQVTPKWLTDVLNRAGLPGTVYAVEATAIGAGQVGDNARFVLHADGDLPGTLVGKFPSAEPLSRQTGIALRNYEREVFFYQTIQPTVAIRTPKVFATEFDPATHDFVVLMEDLAPGVQINQMSECSTDQAALALEQLAGLQGPRWDDPRLLGYSLLVRPTTSEIQPPIYRQLQGGFIERYADRLETRERETVERFGALLEGYFADTGAQTLVHIDYRLDNMMFGGPAPLTVFDWQSVGLGCGLLDASYFMGTSLTPAHRAREESALLRHYLEELRRYGVELDDDKGWTLYRRFAPAGLHMAVVASMIVGETERGNDMFMAMAKRSIAMCEDLDSLALIG